MEYRDREVNRLLASGASASSNRERDEALSLAVQGRKAFDEARLAVDLLSETGPRQRRILALQAEVEQAQADLDKADWRWKNCIIRAPISGTILSKKAEKGNIVNPVAFNVSASLCDMANLRQLEVDLNIQERDIAQVVQEQECRVVPEAFQRNEAFRQRHPEGYRGTVSRLMPIADRSKGAIPVRVEIHPDQIPPEEEGMFLKPEMSVIVSFFQKKI
jgi:multidrug resistance efflux pump